MPAPVAIRNPPARKARFGRTLTHALPWLTAIWVFLELLSLRLGLLNPFFYDTLHADTQGIDFYSLPKAWLNLAAGRSLYATFDPPSFGPHFTWYLAHPLLATLLGGPLSRLDPGDSYGLFTFVSLGVMAASAALLARETPHGLTRTLIWLLLLCAFPTFSMLYVGNVQAFTVLGLALLFIGMLRVLQGRPRAHAFVLAGLLVSLFTKPVVLLMLPLLGLLRETRRAATQSVAIYVPVSLGFEFTPVLNPEHTSLRRVLWLTVHPAFVRQTMNIYTDRFQLTPDMRDNSIHWFNLIAQSGFRFAHIDVVSLPAFLDTLLDTHTLGWLYLLPPLAVLTLSVAVARIAQPHRRRQSALLLTLAASLSFFLTYPTVWEYQYTAVLPVAAMLLLLGIGRSQDPESGTRALTPHQWSWAVALAVCPALPSLYFLSGSADPTPSVLTLTRLDRVVPVTLLFFLLVWTVARSLAEPELQPGR